MPFGQRKKIIEKARSKGKKGKSGSGNNGPDIATGTQVHPPNYCKLSMTEKNR